MKFELSQKVAIVGGQEVGTVQGRCEFVAREPQYLVRYRDAKGCAQECWWDENALTKDESTPPHTQG